MDLAEFLLARLAEDFEVAQRESVWPNGKPRSPLDWDHVAGDADSMLVSMFSPARVLAEVDAKRQIIEHVTSWEHDDPDSGGYYSCPLVPGSSRARDDWWDGKECWCGLIARQLAILGPLTLPYADHPQCHPSWLPAVKA